MKNPKMPSKDGAKKAAEIFRKTRRKQPSDELVKIISEIPEIKDKSSIERAAKDLGM